MGRQINYYMGYNDFKKIAQLAIDNGCEILKIENGKIIHNNDISIITSDNNRYYFYVPEAGPLTFDPRKGVENIYGYNAFSNSTIEASFSIINNTKKKIYRARLFSITGYYDEFGTLIERPNCVNRVYNKLVKEIKKIAPYTEITEAINTNNNEREIWKHKEYITSSLLTLMLESDYKRSI